MKKLAKIVFFGNERLATGVTSSPLILKSLVDGGYDVVALVLHLADKTTIEPSAEYAKSVNIPIIYSDDVAITTNTLAGLSADVGVLAAFGQIVPETLIHLFPLGIINLHPSRLPAYRGPTPIEQAILDGLESTAVSIMQLGPGMDSGPVFAQRDVEIYDQETKQRLSERLQEEGCKLMMEVLPDILSGTLIPTEQDHDKKTVCRLLTKQSGAVDWADEARVIEKSIRAFAGWPRSKATIGSIAVIITKAHAVPAGNGMPGSVEITDPPGILNVNCGEGYLCIEALIPIGKKEMNAREFLNGYKARII